MSNWRDELLTVIKSKAEREAEEEERRRKRIEAALAVADEAYAKARDALTFANEKIASKSQPAALEDSEQAISLSLFDLCLRVTLRREDAVIEVVYGDGKPREFDFANDRHLAPRDVDDYVGRRLLELARSAQQEHPW